MHRSNDIEIIRNYSVTQKLFQAVRASEKSSALSANSHPQMSLKASCATEDVRQNLKADVLDDLDVLEKVLSSDVLRATALCQSPGDALTFTHSVKVRICAALPCLLLKFFRHCWISTNTSVLAKPHFAVARCVWLTV